MRRFGCTVAVIVCLSASGSTVQAQDKRRFGYTETKFTYLDYGKLANAQNVLAVVMRE